MPSPRLCSHLSLYHNGHPGVAPVSAHRATGLAEMLRKVIVCFLGAVAFGQELVDDTLEVSPEDDEGLK